MKKICDTCGFARSVYDFPKWKNQYKSGRRTTCKRCLKKKKLGEEIFTAEQVADYLAKWKTAFNHSMVYVQFCVQGLLTEEILQYRKAIMEHPIFRHEIKRHFNVIEKLRNDYDKKIGRHYDDRSVELIDDHVEHFVNCIKDKRTQMYYGIANHYCKQNHPERHIITIVEYLNSIAEILAYVRTEAVNKLNKHQISLEAISAFTLDNALVHLTSMTKLCRKQLKYEAPDECEHLNTAMKNLVRVIDTFFNKQVDATQRLYFGEDYHKLLKNANDFIK